MTEKRSQICTACNKIIDSSEKRFEDDGFIYHAKCFTCDKCGDLLSTGVYTEVDGERVCSKCRKQEVCLRCGFVISNEISSEVDGKFWHKDCFVCTSCKKPLDKFFEKDHQFYCAECAILAEKHCAQCGKKIKDSRKIVKELGKIWHHDCFRCHYCNRDVSDYFAERRGFPYCKVCEHKSIPSKRQANASNVNARTLNLSNSGGVGGADQISPRGVGGVSPRGNLGDSTSPRGDNVDENATSPRKGIPLKKSPSVVPEALREGLDPKKKFVTSERKERPSLW